MQMIGWNKQEIKIQAQNLAMFGYGQCSHRATSTRNPLYARTFVIQQSEQKDLILCCLDMGCITYAMRDQVVQQLIDQDWFDPEFLVLMATHTHSAPGGCGYEALYNMPTPGYVPEHVTAIREAVVASIHQARMRAQLTEIRMGQAAFADHVPVAWNRSLQAYNRNPDVIHYTENQTHHAVDRNMQVLGFYRDGHLQALMSIFGVHATCLGNQLNQYDGDNKGYASVLSEEKLQAQGVDEPIAIFAQATAGDVSPHFHGKQQLKIRQAISGEAEYHYAAQNGRYQSEQAFLALTQARPMQAITCDAICEYIDLSRIQVDAEFAFGRSNARTSQACHGAVFFAGTPVDGLGAPKPVVLAMKVLAERIRKQRLNPKYAGRELYQALYDSQGPKAIVLEAGRKRLLGQSLDVVPSIFDPLIAEMNRQVKAGAIEQSEMVAHIVPIQLLRIGEISLICCPGEITTTAGKRLIDTVSMALRAQASQPDSKHLMQNDTQHYMQDHVPDDAKDHAQVLLMSYCNDYMGYVTTYEEYQQQAYEGGHTLFGQWTLAALQTKYKALAQQFTRPVAQRQYDKGLRPSLPPLHELEKRTYYGKT